MNSAARYTPAQRAKHHFVRMWSQPTARYFGHVGRMLGWSYSVEKGRYVPYFAGPLSART